MAIFSNFFFSQYRPGKWVFYDILERENVFLDYKTKKLIKSKKWHIFKVVNPWFWSKNGHFSNLFFLGNIGHKNVFYHILERRNAFLDYENKIFKQSKIWLFCKGVKPWFWSKNGHFSNFFFNQFRLGKWVFSRYSRTKKRLIRL